MAEPYFRFYINTKTFLIKYLLEKPEGEDWEEISEKQYLLYVGVVNRYAPLRNTAMIEANKIEVL